MLSLAHIKLKAIKVRKYLDQATTEKLVHAFVMSRLDSCNSLLYGLPVSLLFKMQSTQNSTARIVSRKRLHDHISPILNELHWLPVEKRIIFKLLIMAYKCNQGVAPQYLLDIVKSYQPRQPARNLRSSPINLLTPYSAITKRYGQRAFQYAIPKLWNSLPNHLRECQSFEQFKLN